MSIKINMKKQVVLPKYTQLLEQMGENLKLARKRRKLTTTQVAEKQAFRVRLYIWQRKANQLYHWEHISIF